MQTRLPGTNPHPKWFAAKPKSRRGISRKVLLAALGGLMLLTSFSVLGFFIYTNPTPDASKQLEIGLRLLRKGDGDSSAKIALSIPSESIKKRSDRSKQEFLLGVHQRRSAETIEQRRVAIEHNERAVKHLSKSRDLSFPDGYEGQGNYHLGMALFDLLRWEEAEPALEIAADRWPQGRADSIERLVDIDLSPVNNDTDGAIARIDEWRALPRSTTFEEDRANVKEMQTLFVRGDMLSASKILERVSADSPQRAVAELLFGRCMQQIARKSAEPTRTESFRSSLDSFQRVLGLPNTPVKVRRQCNLELGRIMREMGNVSQAVSTFSMLRLSSPFEPESLASGLEEIDCLIELGRTADAVATLEHMTKNFGEPRWYENDWMPIAEMRKKLVASGDVMISKGAYADSARFASWLLPVCDDMDRLRLNSRLYDLWARKLRSDGELGGVVETHHRLAADAYSSLARKMMRAPEYRLAGDYDASNRQLDMYLQFESRENQPLGLLAKARNYNSLEKFDLALATLNRILESNTSTSLLFDARLEAAKLLAAKDDFSEAEELIVQNLYYSDLKPESPIWRDSLFELGQLLYRRGESLQSKATNKTLESSANSYEHLAAVEQSYNELIRSISRIEEGLRRFETDPRRPEMLYTTAKAYELASSWPALLLRENRVVNEDTIATWKAQQRELLTNSRNTYRKLRQEIVSNTENTPIKSTSSTSNAENFLRNSFFGEADLLFGAGEYEEAMIAYRDAANRFINEPESIEAMVQIANCHKQLGKPQESRRALEMTKDMLQRITRDKDGKFKIVTSHDRVGWEKYIDWMLNDLTSK
jgi:tetratricopeptide (TPR) repeat protein